MLKMADMTEILERMRAEQGVHVPMPATPRIFRPDEPTIKRALKRVENAKKYMAVKKRQMEAHPERDWYRDYFKEAQARYRKQVKRLEELQGMIIQIAEERAPKRKRDPKAAHARLVAREQRWVAGQLKRLIAGEISSQIFNDIQASAVERVIDNAQRLAAKGIQV